MEPFRANMQSLKNNKSNEEMFTIVFAQDGLSLLMVAVYSTFDKARISAILHLLLDEVNIAQLTLGSSLADKVCWHLNVYFFTQTYLDTKTLHN